MSINPLQDAIIEMLHHDNYELQIAAVRVLGACKVSDPRAMKAMGELLLRDANPELRTAIIEVFATAANPAIMKYLIQCLAKESGNSARTLNALVAGGDESIVALRAQFGTLPAAAQRQAVTIIPLIRTPVAHQFYIDRCYAQDNDLIREMIHSLRENFASYRVKEVADLHEKITDELEGRGAKDSGPALSAFIITLGIIGSVNDYKLLLPFLKDNFSPVVRRHALMSLGNFAYSSTKHEDLMNALTEIIDGNSSEELVRYAVAALSKFKLRRNDNDWVRGLLNSKYPAVKLFAVQMLVVVDSIANANTVLDLWHSSRDSGLRDAAVDVMRKMSSSVSVILRHLEEFTGRAEAYELVQILESHANRITEEKAKELFDRMFTLYQKRHLECYQLYRTALSHLRGEVLKREVIALAHKERQQKNWAGVRNMLGILDHTELLTPDMRLDLAVAQLKTGKHNRSKSARETDPCLENFKWFLRESEKGVCEKLLANKYLVPEDLLYLGYHFSEQLNAERRFGLEMLKYLASKYANDEVGKTAAQKLKAEGH